MMNENIKQKNKNNRAFTLIELMVVIAIIGILSAIAFVSYSSIREKSLKSYAKSSIKSLMNDLDLYYIKNNFSYDGYGDADSALYKMLEGGSKFMFFGMGDSYYAFRDYFGFALYLGRDYSEVSTLDDSSNIQFFKTLEPKIFYTFSSKAGISDYENSHFSETEMTYDEAISFCESFGEKLPYSQEFTGVPKLPNRFQPDRYYWGHSFDRTKSKKLVGYFYNFIDPTNGGSYWATNIDDGVEIPYSSRNSYSYYVACAK